MKLPILLILAAASQSVELTCNRDALVLVLRATAGVPTGIADLDMPRLSMLDTEAARAAAVAARNERVKRVAEVILADCAKPAAVKEP